MAEVLPSAEANSVPWSALGSELLVDEVLVEMEHHPVPQPDDQRLLHLGESAVDEAHDGPEVSKGG